MRCLKVFAEVDTVVHLVQRAVHDCRRTCHRPSLGLLLSLRQQLGCLPLQATGLGVESLALALKHGATHRLQHKKRRERVVRVEKRAGMPIVRCYSSVP